MKKNKILLYMIRVNLINIMLHGRNQTEKSKSHTVRVTYLNFTKEKLINRSHVVIIFIGANN